VLHFVKALLYRGRPTSTTSWWTAYTSSITDKAAIIKICSALKKAYLGLCYANHIFLT